jgi:hypothetical protein
VKFISKCAYAKKHGVFSIIEKLVNFQSVGEYNEIITSIFKGFYIRVEKVVAIHPSFRGVIPTVMLQYEHVRSRCTKWYVLHRQPFYLSKMLICYYTIFYF